MIKFGTGGFRAIIGEDFNKENVQLVAQGLCNLIAKENGVKQMVVGFDRRFMSDDFAKWIAEVLAGNKVKTQLTTSAVPTPLVMLATKDFGNTFGIMVTASHNPYIYNGIKVFTVGGKDGDVEFTAKLEKEVKKIKNVKTMDYETALVNGLIQTLDYMPNYIANLKKHLKPVKEINNNKILFNVMNGVTGEAIEQVGKLMKLKNLVLERPEHDAFFEFKLPSPNPNTLKDFAVKIVKEKYNFGLACDADGDRVSLIDEKGNIYGGNTIMAIVYYYLIKYRHECGDIVINLASSFLLKNLAENLHFTCHEVPVGFKWLSSKLLETNALMCGESSGGLTIRNYILGKDSMIACSLLIEAQREINKPFSKIIDDINSLANYHGTFIEKTFVVSNRAKFEKWLSSHQPKFEEEITAIRSDDGKKFYVADGSWALIRFSGCEPILRLFVESNDSEKAATLMAGIIKFTIDEDKTAHEIIQ